MQKDFLTVTPDSGGGNSTLNITSAPNPAGGGVRSATIVISGGGVTKHVTVSQKQGYVHENDLVLVAMLSGAPSGVTLEYDLQDGININGNIWIDGDRTQNFEIIIKFKEGFELKEVQQGAFVSPDGGAVPWTAVPNAMAVKIIIPIGINPAVFIAETPEIIFTSAGHDVSISFGIAIHILK